MTEPSPYDHPAGTRVRITHEVQRYTDTIPAGVEGQIVRYSPPHHTENGGGYSVDVAIIGRLWLGPDFDAMDGKWEDPITGRTILTRKTPYLSVWSRWLEVIE